MGRRRTPRDATGAAHTGDDGAEPLKRAVARAQEGQGSRRDLEAAASVYIAGLKTRQLPPEEMLVRVKAILAECGLRPAQPPHDKSAVPTGGSLYHHVIAWCIEQYYRTS